MYVRLRVCQVRVYILDWFNCFNCRLVTKFCDLLKGNALFNTNFLYGNFVRYSIVVYVGGNILKKLKYFYA